jgi:hypothetical protein
VNENFRAIELLPEARGLDTLPSLELGEFNFVKANETLRIIKFGVEAITCFR